MKPNSVLKLKHAAWASIGLLAVVLLVAVTHSGARPPTNPIAAECLLANHGRGIFLMKQLMDEVDFRFDHGTEVRMRRRRQWLE